MENISYFDIFDIEDIQKLLAGEPGEHSHLEQKCPMTGAKLGCFRFRLNRTICSSHYNINDMVLDVVQFDAKTPRGET